MQLTRERKEAIVQELTEKMEDAPVIGVLDMHSLPAKQLQEIKKELKDDADIMMTRKTLIQRALENADRDNITDLADNTAIQPALIFSEANPFRLYKIIQDKKTSAAASGGEIAPNNIEIPEGSTGLDPGPMLGEIQQFGAQTAVEDGKIAVTQGAIAAEEGEVITPGLAKVLNALGMEPLEVGLDLKMVYENGEVFRKDVLAIDIDEYRTNFEAAASQSFNLAVNAGVVNAYTAEPIIINAVQHARNLAVNAGIIDEDVIEDLLSKAAGEASALYGQIDLDTAVEDSDDADESDADNSDDAEASEEDADTEADEQNDDTDDEEVN